MAMKARYTVANGEVIAQKRGGVRSLLVPDPLGSTVALFDATQTKTDTWSYFPYGEVKTRTGATTLPFQFVGSLGYYRDDAAREFAGATFVDVTKGRWICNAIGQSLIDTTFTFGLCAPINMLAKQSIRPLQQYIPPTCEKCLDKYSCDMNSECAIDNKPDVGPGYDYIRHCCITPKGCCTIDGLGWNVIKLNPGATCPPFCFPSGKVVSGPDPKSRCTGRGQNWLCRPSVVVGLPTA